MRIAVGSDMATSLTDVVVADLRERGHDVTTFGALSDGSTAWPEVAITVARAVSSGDYHQGILFCWTGTGIALAANKVSGIRAALCADAKTAEGARKWNDANILAMSLRLTSEEIAKEILRAWFDTAPSPESGDQACLDYLRDYEKTHLPSARTSALDPE